MDVNNFILVRGIPDDGLDFSRIISLGETIQCLFPGTADFINEMPDEIKSWRQLFLPIDPQKEFIVSGKPFLVNHMGDPDAYAAALSQALEIIDRHKLSIFNHPRQILKLRRDSLRTVFGHIQGLVIPKCIRINVEHISILIRTIEEQGFKYPVIFRIAGTHGGKTQKLIPTPNEWHGINGLGWENKNVYVSEFINYKDSDGFYRKQRLAVVGGEAIPRHGCLNYQWSVSGIDSPPETIEEELNWTKSFYKETWPLIETRIGHMIKATRLDYFGIDYSLRKDGEILVFEVTASMSMTRPFLTQSHHSIEYIPKIIQKKLATLLRSPSNWVEGY